MTLKFTEKFAHVVRNNVLHVLCVQPQGNNRNYFQFRICYLTDTLGYIVQPRFSFMFGGL